MSNFLTKERHLPPWLWTFLRICGDVIGWTLAIIIGIFWVVSALFIIVIVGCLFISFIGFLFGGQNKDNR